MIEDDGVHVQFCYLPDENIFGQVVGENLYFYTVRYTRNNVVHEEIFSVDDVILMKEIHIPIDREEHQ